MLLLLLACKDEPVCADGFTAGDDGLCYEDAAEEEEEETQDTPDDTPDDGGSATVEDVLDSLPPCEPGATDGRLDIDGACADGACAGMTYDEIAAALGGDGDCGVTTISFDDYTYRSIDCAWPSGISADFADSDEDSVPDGPSTGLGVDLPWDGGTPEGLGLGASLSCFVEELGYPDSVSFDLPFVGYDLGSLSYYGDPSVSVRDWYDNATGDFVPDGLVDSLALYGD